MNSSLKKVISPLFNIVSDLSSIKNVAHRSVYNARFRRWCSDNPCPTFVGPTVFYSHICENHGLDVPIDYLEFGVYQGATIRWWVENNHFPSSSFTGFDWFEGLPGDWDGTPEGSFSAGGVVPDIRDPRCRFVKGLFQDTLPTWIAGRKFDNRLVIHLDADLYNATLLVLIHLLPHVKIGDVILFDEMSNYMHEFRLPRRDFGLPEKVRGALQFRARRPPLGGRGHESGLSLYFGEPG